MSGGGEGRAGSPRASDDFIDLRSDTVTQPTDEMRRAMAAAEVGDDVYGEDPTVRALEEAAAAMLGMPAALFVPTGTMANQIAIHLHTRPTDEVIIEASGHSYDWELAGMGVLSGVQPRVIEGDRGVLPVEAVREALAARPAIRSRVGLLIAENTHNMAGGRIWPRAATAAVVSLCRESGVATHLDGARLFHAAVASGTPVARLADGFDSVMVSLSKGLSAPAGSLLAGSPELVVDARRVRKLFGGGMRQVGVLAAAGIVALETMIERLAEDHANARALATGLHEIPGISAPFGEVETNIVIVDVASTGLGGNELVAALRERRVLCMTTRPSFVKFVLHRGVAAADVDTVLAAVRSALGV